MPNQIWFYVDSSGNRRKFDALYYLDSSGNRRKFGDIWYGDNQTGNRRQWTPVAAPVGTTLSGRATYNGNIAAGTTINLVALVIPTMTRVLIYSTVTDASGYYLFDLENITTTANLGAISTGASIVAEIAGAPAGTTNYQERVGVTPEAFAVATSSPYRIDKQADNTIRIIDRASGNAVSQIVDINALNQTIVVRIDNPASGTTVGSGAFNIDGTLVNYTGSGTVTYTWEVRRRNGNTGTWGVWNQTGIANPTNLHTSFAGGSVSSIEQLEFRLTGTDGTLTGQATTTVNLSSFVFAPTGPSNTLQVQLGIGTSPTNIVAFSQWMSWDSLSVSPNGVVGIGLPPPAGQTLYVRFHWDDWASTYPSGNGPGDFPAQFYLSVNYSSVFSGMNGFVSGAGATNFYFDPSQPNTSKWGALGGRSGDLGPGFLLLALEVTSIDNTSGSTYVGPTWGAFTLGAQSQYAFTPTLSVSGRTVTCTSHTGAPYAFYWVATSGSNNLYNASTASTNSLTVPGSGRTEVTCWVSPGAGGGFNNNGGVASVVIN